MNLTNKKCEPCEGGIPPISRGDFEKYQKELSNDWSTETYGKEGERFGANKKLVREFEFDDFQEAMNFVNKVARLAESEGHHPDIEISYNKVSFSITTHAIGGLSENDFILAAKIDSLVN